MEIPQKIKNVPTFKPSSPNSGNISEGTQNTNSKEHKHCYIHCSIIYNRQYIEAAQVSISRRVDKTTVVHIHSGILLSCKKEENFILFLRKRFYLLIFGQREREGERERNINVWLPLARPPTGDLVCNPGTCPDWESNQ